MRLDGKVKFVSLVCQISLVLLGLIRWLQRLVCQFIKILTTMHVP